MEILKCLNVSFGYNKKNNINYKINLNVKKGETVCILGPNGAGKTTLLRQITGDLKPTSGIININGCNYKDNEIKIRNMLGIIPQEVGLFNTLTALDHLIYIGKLKGVNKLKLKDRIECLTIECGLEKILKSKVGKLSTGQKRKILVALALINEPEILILDEPTVGLDPLIRRELWDLLLKQKQKGKTILLTTHYLDEAEFLSDRICFIENGEIKICGTIHELYQRLGKSVKVTIFNEYGNSIIDTYYFDSQVEAQNFIESSAHKCYYLGRINLDDIYNRLFGGRGYV